MIVSLLDYSHDSPTSSELFGYFFEPNERAGESRIFAFIRPCRPTVSKETTAQADQSWYDTTKHLKVNGIWRMRGCWKRKFDGQANLFAQHINMTKNHNQNPGATLNCMTLTRGGDATCLVCLGIIAFQLYRSPHGHRRLKDWVPL